jgi:hypothetical protein
MTRKLLIGCFIFSLMLGSSIAGAEERPSEEAPMLSRIPYLNRMFKNVALAEDADVERIGIDFDFDFNLEQVHADMPKRQSKRDRRQRLEAENRALLVENARLQAQLEFAEERAELIAEIARLKEGSRTATRPRNGRVRR